MRKRSNKMMSTRQRQEGMSLIELMIALTILAVGLAALMGLLVTAVGTNNRNKLDTGGTLAAQAVLEAIAAQPGGSQIKIYDCAGNTILANTAPNTSVNVCDGSICSVGDVDFTQTSGIASNYSASYVSCGANGGQATYDVRWRIQDMPCGTGCSEKLITVGAAQTAVVSAQKTKMQSKYARPITLRTISATGN